jgi:Cu-Zn family superoxide dismutase
MLTIAVVGVLTFGLQATAHQATFRTTLRDANGRVVGTVKFHINRNSMSVNAKLRPNANVERSRFHGLHIHANNDPANGRGCIADPAGPRADWFVSADGHLSESAQGHGAHNGDLPSALVMADGTARLRFRTDRIEPRILRGRAVILHAEPDNFGNIPLGTESNQYTANSAAATELTARTGNASHRVACGVIGRSS